MTSDPYVAAVFARRPQPGDIVDAHAHLGPDAGSPFVTHDLGRYVAGMDRLGIRLACVSAVPSLLGDATRGNRLVEAAMRAYPDRFFGYMCADIGYPERILPEMERGLAVGFRGVKVWSYGARPGLPYNHPNYQPVFSFAAKHSLPVLAHTWGGELAQLEPIARQYPQVNWLLAHTASDRKEEYIRLAHEYPNVYLELCLSSCPRHLVEELVAAGLEDKTIWGSDALFLDAAQQIGRVVFAQIAPHQKGKILGDNARRALRLDEAPAPAARP